jgi:hypothetical protein
MDEIKCLKCGHISDKNRSKYGLVLCSVCIAFAPNTPEELDKYIEENISPSALKELDKFRRYSSYRGENQKKGMINQSSKGLHMSRVPFGYKRNAEGILIPAQNSREIEEIFEEFILPETTLSILSKKHNLSINGLKKILRNFAYVGKVKFDGQIHSANHQPLVSWILFNKVQDKLDKLKKKN